MAIGSMSIKYNDFVYYKQSSPMRLYTAQSFKYFADHSITPGQDNLCKGLVTMYMFLVLRFRIGTNFPARPSPHDQALPNEQLLNTTKPMDTSRKSLYQLSEIARYGYLPNILHLDTDGRPCQTPASSIHIIGQNMPGTVLSCDWGLKVPQYLAQKFAFKCLGYYP